MLSFLMVALLVPSLGWGGVVYRDIGVDMTVPDSSYELDMDGDGAPDFRLHHSPFGREGGSFPMALFDIRAAGGSSNKISVTSITNSVFTAKDYHSGDTIGPEITPWHNEGELNGYVTVFSHDLPFGRFYSKNAYVGVSFLIGAGRHYGWVDIRSSDLPSTSSSPSIGGVIAGVAYENRPGIGIVTPADTAIQSGGPGGAIILTWALTSGAVSHVQYSTSLTSIAWSDLETISSAAGTLTNTATDGTRFYRVIAK